MGDLPSVVLRRPWEVFGPGLSLDSPAIVCYNTLLKGAQMQDMYKLQLDRAMLALQALIDQEFEENESIQTAFNALACALDEELYEE